MTNEELKKKIVEILEETECEWTEEKNGYILQIFYDKLADALIAAVIGDVKEAEHRAARAERALDLCETAYILSLNHRATEGISGQAIASDFGIHKFFMKQAEKELAEENDGKKEV